MSKELNRCCCGGELKEVERIERRERVGTDNMGPSLLIIQKCLSCNLTRLIPTDLSRPQQHPLISNLLGNSPQSCEGNKAPHKRPHT